MKQLQSGKVEITAHNHNFAVDPDSLPQSEVELTHMDLNDNTLEGLRHRNLPLFSVQYHPERSGARPSRFALSVQRFREDDGGVEEEVSAKPMPVARETGAVDLLEFLPSNFVILLTFRLRFLGSPKMKVSSN